MHDVVQLMVAHTMMIVRMHSSCIRTRVFPMVTMRMTRVVVFGTRGKIIVVHVARG